MGEQRIIPIFVFAVTFIAVFAIIAALIPPEFFVSSKEYTAPLVPASFSALDLTQIAWFDNDTVLPSHDEDNPCKFFLPPISPKKEVWGFWFDGLGLPRSLCFKHIWVSWYVIQSHVIEGLHNEGYGFERDEIVNAWNSELNCSEIDSQCACGTVYFIFLAYNQTKYTSIGNAFDNKEIEVLIGVGWADTLTRMDAWGILASLLSFQGLGIPEPLNYIITIPFYACIGILAVLLVLELIPF